MSYPRDLVTEDTVEIDVKEAPGTTGSFVKIKHKQEMNFEHFQRSN